MWSLFARLHLFLQQQALMSRSKCYDFIICIQNAEGLCENITNLHNRYPVPESKTTETLEQVFDHKEHTES